MRAGSRVNRHDYAGSRVTVLGMARQGTALARFMLARGADVTLSDLRSAEQLAAPRSELESYAAKLGRRPPYFVFGGHPHELLAGTDLLCLSGGVSPDIPIVQEALRRGIPLSNDGQLTLRHCPVPIIGITGSAGKTTTTTLTGLMLEASGYRVHVGGNIGTPLIDRLETISPGDKVVMELSSFQLELFSSSPAIAAILNITPNHLDRHPSMSHYAAAKANILRFQGRGDTAVLGADDPVTGTWLSMARCEIAAGVGQEPVYFPLLATRLAFSLAGAVSAGAFLEGDRLIWCQPGMPDADVCRVEAVRLRGRHNLANVLAACCLAGAAGATVAAMRDVASTFGGVEHRLEIVRQRAGVLWVNDSIATAPERTIAALRSFAEPVVLLLGGRDKHLPWDDCVREIHRVRCNGTPGVRRVILFGEAARLIRTALESYEKDSPGEPVPVQECAGLPDAVAAAARAARPGDVVLLAPGGTSFDAYEDFAARGQHYRSLVEVLP